MAPRGLRIFWLMYAAAVVIWSVILTAPTLGPAIETWAAPIRLDQRIEAVTRTTGRLCWRWKSLKARSAISDNIDAFLIAGSDRFVVVPFDEASGLPWRLSGNVPPGPQSTRLCVGIPPTVAPATPVRLEQTIFYRGWRGLWSLRVPVPDIDDPAAR